MVQPLIPIRGDDIKMQILSVSDIIEATSGALVCGEKGLEINDITTDSRKSAAGVLFIPLKGEKADGHDFILSALNAGAVTLSERDDEYDKGTVIRVKDTRKALGDIARFYKIKYPVKSVAITGSVGKTTTKDLVYSVIAQGY
ncbi:MAG: UDP-N-acetylmuramoyl-tripeptide--D-alanyl-D-alanine ligase, partial [Clostridia bacterium]|nr:UDP-N-acetylmuramoyl-tripeptide--D-alanyl-D-alanine ligase [Clostridia bacterium]